MSLPVNIDLYSRLITVDDNELQEQHVSSVILERLHRIRGLYAYWLQFPSKFDNEIVNYDMAMFKISRAQAYDDLHLTQTLLGNIQQASKEFIRWKINKDLEEDLKAARRSQDHRSVAAIEKNRILNNRTDKDDEQEFEFDKIVPQTFEPTDDPTVIGIDKIPDLRGKIRKLVEKYSKDNIEYADFEEVEDDGENRSE
jgi:hypothetical protein